MLDKILERLNLKYEDLTREEKDTLEGWLDNLKRKTISLDSIRGHIANMKASVEGELTKTDLSTKQDLFLKARLRNYMLLEAYLSTPERAKKALEEAIEGISMRTKVGDDNGN
jgi:hypothetical protein